MYNHYNTDCNTNYINSIQPLLIWILSLNLSLLRQHRAKTLTTAPEK